MTAMPAQARWRLDDWLAYQETLNPRSIELGLERVREAAERLQLLPPLAITLTVGGTNGKGSTATLLGEIYRCAGYRTGVYTSPHLLRYNERIAIDGEPASDDALCSAFTAIEAARGTVRLTYFEFGTLAALWLFRQAGVAVQVLEIGLGGRLDAVNVVDADAALLTNVGLDHTDWLGSDRESIAREKAAIFRTGRAAVCVDPDPPAAVAAAAAQIGAQQLMLGSHFDFDWSVNGGSWDWRGRETSYAALPRPALDGAVQLRNAAGALAAVEALGGRLPVDEAAIRTALAQVRLRGRFERCGDVIFDVAHNVEAAAVLAQNLRDAGVAGRVRLVLGMLSDKPVEGYAEVLAPLVKACYCGGLPAPRGLTGLQLADRARSLHGAAFPDILSAFAAARQDLQQGEVVVVCGSFLTVAEVAGR